MGWTNKSARVLKPSGYLIAYCNQRYIDKLIHIFSKLLNYHWIYCINLNGDNRYGNNGVIEKWQPVLVYSKRTLNKKGNQKSFSCFDNSDTVEYSIQYFLNTYSEQNDVILDPFLGNGEILRVSKDLKRRYIGIDVDSDRVEIAKGLSL